MTARIRCASPSTPKPKWIYAIPHAAARRVAKGVQADDHDMGDKSKLVPLGILDVMSVAHDYLRCLI